MKSLAPHGILADQIQVHKSLLDNELCDLIIKEYEDDLFEYGTHLTPTSDRDLHELNISDNSVICRKNSYVRKNIDARIADCVGSLFSIYPATVQFDTGYSLRRMVPGQKYVEHQDQGLSCDWQISCSIGLSEKHEGGQLCFFDEQLCFDVKKGNAITFPSNFLYPHSVSEVKSGTRYVLTTWLY